MSTPSSTYETVHTGGTRWLRAVAAMAIGLGALAGLWSLVRTNVLATYLTITSQASPATFNTNMVAGNYVGFGMVPTRVGSSSTQKSVLRASFAVASLDGFCLSKQETVGGLTVWLTLKAGNGTANNGTGSYSGTAAGDTDPISGMAFPFKDIEASDLSFDITSVTTGNSSSTQGLTLGGMDQIGLASPDVSTIKSGGSYVSNPLGAPTTSNGNGWTGIMGTYGSLNQVKGVINSAEIKSIFSMPKLSIKVSTSGSNCNDASTAFSQ